MPKERAQALSITKCEIKKRKGSVKPLINYGFADREALEKELGKLKELDLWKDKMFEEVSIEELKEKGAAGKVEQKRYKMSWDISLTDRVKSGYKFVVACMLFGEIAVCFHNSTI